MGVEGQVTKVIQNRLTFTNPKWEENEKRGFSNWQTPRELCFLEKHGYVLAMPRGFTRQALGILKYHGVTYELADRRRVLPRWISPFKANSGTSRLRRFKPYSPGTSKPWRPPPAQERPSWPWPW